MTNDKEELNTALYDKMSREFEQLRSDISEQPYYLFSERAYEFCTKLEILMVQESRQLPSEQAKALLQTDSPLDEVYQSMKGQESEHLDMIANCMAAQANRLIQERQTITEAQENTPSPYYKELLAKPLEEITEDIFLRADTFQAAPWYDDLALYTRIGACAPQAEHIPELQKALKMLGYPTHSFSSKGRIYLAPGEVTAQQTQELQENDISEYER